MDPVISPVDTTVAQREASPPEALFAALYSELHRMARRELARNGCGATLGVTTLLHESYLDVAARDGTSFDDRARFMAYVARVMRGLIVDHVRNRRAGKRGGDVEITPLETDAMHIVGDEGELTQIGEALEALARIDPSLAEVVDLRFFCGFSFSEIAAMRGISERTVQRQWEKARIYLHRAIRPHPPC